MMNDEKIIKEKLNRETGKITWPELEPHYMAGVVVCVDANLDLIEVAFEFNQDNRTQVERWLTSGEIYKPSSDQANTWSENQECLWAVVVAPWVLVQKIK